jgi:SPP1 gp7 family putative phage head morphogenesis protein
MTPLAARQIAPASIPSVYVRAQRTDPTRTTVLRDSFEREMRKRFIALKLAIKRAVVDQDVFGLVQSPDIIGRLVTQAELDIPTHRTFDFPTSQQKKDAFIDWLKKQEAAGILETMRIPQFGQAIEEAWTDLFIKDAYSRGVQRARYEMGKAGYPVPTLEETGGLIGSMSLPIHVDRLGTVYARAFDGLKGITSAMDMQVSHILAQGLADGDNPILLAKKLIATIDGVNGQSLGITDSLGRFIPAERRARMLARTEIIRSHSIGLLQEAKMWGVVGVEADVEFVNAGFNVCPICRSLQGKIYTIEQAMNVIPVHPSCRCSWIIVPRK